MAAEEGFKETVQILLEYGSNSDLQDEVLIFFFFLCDGRCLCCSVFYLLFVKDGKTALHYAAEKGFEEIVKFVLEHGSNVDLQDQVLIFFF